jgi:hypothetical protein
MNCQRFEDVVNDIAREQILEVTVRSEALGHARECRHCAVRLEDELALTLRLRDLATSFKPAGASERVKAQLLSAFGEMSSVGSPPFRSRKLYWVSAIAAMLLIMFAVSIFQLRRAKPAVPARNAGNDVAVIYETLPAPRPSSSSMSTSAAPHTPVLTTQKTVLTARHGRRGATVTNRAKPDVGGNNEIATDFLPVTYGGVANLEDGGRMVRVELPRSAMASFGLPVNMDRANERVKADVLLGVDGLAHAIRFVR